MMKIRIKATDIEPTSPAKHFAVFLKLKKQNTNKLIPNTNTKY